MPFIHLLFPLKGDVKVVCGAYRDYKYSSTNADTIEHAMHKILYTRIP